MPRINARGKVFRDPVHHLIRIAPEDEFILDLIDTPEFQRLRRIRQLGVSWLTYHGAEHSRFVHSLGVFNFAQRIIQSLRQRYGANDPVTRTLDEHQRTLKAAALLHDLGHAPFSHMLERALAGKHHEERTIELIRDENSQVNRILIHHELNPEDVASVIRKDFPSKLVVDIVSSQLDADRMDYLLRDSYCTGVGYGEYDPEWLLHAMCVGSMNPHGEETHAKLCLDRQRGVYAAERFVMARLHMYQQVYMHRVTRGFEVLLLNLFSAAAHCVQQGDLPSGTPTLVKKYFKQGGVVDGREFLDFDESLIIAALHVWARATKANYKTISQLSTAFLNRERRYASVDLENSMPLMIKLGQMKESLPKETDGVTPIYGIDTIEDTPYKGMLFRAKKGKTPEEIVNESILLSDPQNAGEAQPIESVSRILKDMDAEQFEVIRLYYNRHHYDAIKRLADDLRFQLPPLKG